jgi:hypothetical protein
MKLTVEKGNTRRKNIPLPRCPTEISLGLAVDRIRACALTASLSSLNLANSKWPSVWAVSFACYLLYRHIAPSVFLNPYLKIFLFPLQ